MLKKYLLGLAVLQCIVNSLVAQIPGIFPSSEIYQKIKKLNVLGTVLYMAAHPDDENTALIAYMANEKLYNTGYLSLTRGDGGQNLIGPEIREKLGMIRTQELLQARSIDGGVQFFSRANDFGFSKNPEEVFTKWDRNQILADAVWVIRNFQPDVIITRFPKDSRAGHGQHSASSIIAEEAFDAAADSTMFPDQLKYVRPWKVKRIVWNLSPWGFRSQADFDKYAGGYLHFDIGKYNVFRGKSIGEIAAESRSMHKSQAFGSAGNRGAIPEYFEPTKGPVAKNDLFEDVPTSWGRVPGADSVAYYIRKSIDQYRIDSPSFIVPYLLKAYSLLDKLPNSYYKIEKSKEIKDVIQECMGLYIVSLADKKQVAPGTNLVVNTEITNRSSLPVTLTSIHFSNQPNGERIEKTLALNVPYRNTSDIRIANNFPYTIPYWLKDSFSYAMYHIADQSNVGRPLNAPVITASVRLFVLNDTITLNIPVQYRKVDPARGEVYSPLVIVPEIFLNLEEEVYMFPNGQKRTVEIKVVSNKDAVKGTVSLQLPAHWTSIPEKINLSLEKEGARQNVQFTVVPSSVTASGEIKAIFKDQGAVYDRGITQINYDHIPEQTDMPKAVARVENFNVVKKGNVIGYLMGAGDNVPDALKQLGYQVEMLSEQKITRQALKKYDAVVVGVRAFNTIEKIVYLQNVLLEYVREGGTLIEQYNVNRGLVSNQIGPYPISLSVNRVTDEDAPVRILDKNSPILNSPNKITSEDFDGWVQERGLYFPNQWDPRYKTVIASHDPNEDDLEGGILWTGYGKGYYIYSCYDWFRELPAGIPGAYRLFANMLSIGKK